MNARIGLIVIAFAICGLFYRVLTAKSTEPRPPQDALQESPSHSEAITKPKVAPIAVVPLIKENEPSIEQRVMLLAAETKGISESPAQDLARLKRLAAALTPDQSLELGQFVTSRGQPYFARFTATQLLGLSGVTPSKVKALTQIASAPMDELDQHGFKHEYILRKVAIDEIADNSSTEDAINSIQDVLAQQSNPAVRDQALTMLRVLKAGKLSEYRNQEERLLSSAATGGRS